MEDLTWNKQQQNETSRLMKDIPVYRMDNKYKSISLHLFVCTNFKSNGHSASDPLGGLHPSNISINTDIVIIKNWRHMEIN